MTVIRTSLNMCCSIEWISILNNGSRPHWYLYIRGKLYSRTRYFTSKDFPLSKLLHDANAAQKDDKMPEHTLFNPPMLPLPGRR